MVIGAHQYWSSPLAFTTRNLDAGNILRQKPRAAQVRMVGTSRHRPVPSPASRLRDGRKLPNRCSRDMFRLRPCLATEVWLSSASNDVDVVGSAGNVEDTTKQFVLRGDNTRGWFHSCAPVRWSTIRLLDG